MCYLSQSLYRSKADAGTYHLTMMSLVSSWDTQGLQSQSIRNLAQSLWRKCRVAPMRSRSFILLGPYWTADDSSLVKKSLWNTGGAPLKYFAANLTERRRKLVRIDVGYRKGSCISVWLSAIGPSIFRAWSLQATKSREIFGSFSLIYTNLFW